MSAVCMPFSVGREFTTRVACDYDLYEIKCIDYQKIQVVVHVVEQTADHGRQVDYVGGLVFFEQTFCRL